MCVGVSMYVEVLYRYVYVSYIGVCGSYAGRYRVSVGGRGGVYLCL